MLNGSCTPVDSKEAYAGVVGMETVHLGFLLTEMNGLKVCATNISSAYLYAKTREKCYIIAGPEFGELEVRNLLLTTAFMDSALLVPVSMNILDRNSAIWVTHPVEPSLISGSHGIPMVTTSTLPTMLMMSSVSLIIPCRSLKTSVLIAC